METYHCMKAARDGSAVAKERQSCSGPAAGCRGRLQMELAELHAPGHHDELQTSGGRPVP